MRPKEPRDSDQHDLLRSRLDQIIWTDRAARRRQSEESDHFKVFRSRRS